MRAAKITSQIQEFVMNHEADLRSRTLRDKYPKFEGRLPRKVTEQNTLAISERAQFSMYEPI